VELSVRCAPGIHPRGKADRPDCSAAAEPKLLELFVPLSDLKSGPEKLLRGGKATGPG
jgi:hypothetical protein